MPEKSITWVKTESFKKDRNQSVARHRGVYCHPEPVCTVAITIKTFYDENLKLAILGEHLVFEVLFLQLLQAKQFFDKTKEKGIDAGYSTKKDDFGMYSTSAFFSRDLACVLTLLKLLTELDTEVYGVIDLICEDLGIEQKLRDEIISPTDKHTVASEPPTPEAVSPSLPAVTSPSYAASIIKLGSPVFTPEMSSTEKGNQTNHGCVYPLTY